MTMTNLTTSSRVTNHLLLEKGNGTSNLTRIRNRTVDSQVEEAEVQLSWVWEGVEVILLELLCLECKVRSIEGSITALMRTKM
jgi:hypothetical protein